MESVSTHMQRLEEMLSRIEDVIESSKPIPFSSKVSADKNAIYDIIDEMRPIIDDLVKDLPNEIVQAKRVISDSDKIINDARNKATHVMQEAESEVIRMTSEHEILKAANDRAVQIVEDAKRGAREMRINAMEYADEILANSEGILREATEAFSRKMRETEASFSDTIDMIYENRQELRGTKK